MQESDNDMPAELKRPRTVTVLGLMTLAALVLSWLGSYALANVLVKADLIAPWAPSSDPRPVRMAISFVSLMLVLSVGAGLFKWMSARELKSIDDSADE